ncbi:endonuclease/exonuclease/phosphatase family protein [Caballeronia sp. AZ7_KS35]|uniref:endonuclease/exonuclease/phosphatase family protein n=1 Tax=Caballeronia sp. AZ7_KS35 TaxID=2921762 RepID=UPI002028FD01|nr:endonuclease/exonuclease/phosphatase family protein [Caballeronia sp. AZ7_KS35]
MKLSFAWWNTSLSPLARPNRATPEERKLASELIQLLAEQLQVDAIALGEVSQEDIEYLSPGLQSLGYELKSGIAKIGRTAFDTCVLYRPEKLVLIGYQDLVSRKSASTLKVAQRIDFLIGQDEPTLHLFVSHWPSRLWCHENDADRHLLGVRLRDELERTGFQDGNAHAVILGDFNDEPFDPAISKQLRATRDRQLASKKPDLLYNPFWRRMGATRPYSAGSLEKGLSGSYFYHSHAYDKWRTFDQIIFSSSFLGRTNWHLREDLIDIVDVASYTEIVQNGTMNFDHLPVIGVVEKAI